MGVKQFGARVTRLEDPALLTGKGRFVDDVASPGGLVASFVRSPHAHARLRGIDTHAACDVPGVVAVLTAKDLPQPAASERMPMLVPNTAIKALRTQHALAVDEVCYVGQTIVVVVAESR
jgi:carbon-monoxide dehydrogenase large subunit